MEKYTIYCTKEQAKMALELCAPITTIKSRRTKNTILSDDVIEYDEDTFTYVVSPTAEQMIGWLEGQGLFVTTDKSDGGHFFYKIEYGGKYVCKWNSFSSRKEATIAGIDAALKYLNNNKK